MARTDADVRRELVEEREQLVGAIGTLRTEIKAATDVRGRLRAHLPAATAGALGLGFVAAGGIGATVRRLIGRD
jgi:hypothetical protein